MSTNIHTGFKLTTRDFAVIAEWAETWRSLFMQAAEDKLCRVAAQRIAKWIDSPAAYAALLDIDAAQRMLSERDKYGPRSQASEEIRSEVKEIEVSGYRNPQVDIEAKMALYPHEGEVYGIFLCDDGDFARMFFELEGVEEFAYSNSTDDQLDHMTEEEWRARGDTWEAILSSQDKCFFMGGRGFEVKLTDGLVPVLDPKKILAAMPTLEDRCHSVAKDIFHGRKHREAFPEGIGPTVSTGEIVSVMLAADKARRERSGKDEFEKLKGQIGDVLQPEITEDDLREWRHLDPVIAAHATHLKSKGPSL